MTLHNPRLYDHFEKIYIHEYTFTYLTKLLSTECCKFHSFALYLYKKLTMYYGFVDFTTNSGFFQKTAK